MKMKSLAWRLPSHLFMKDSYSDFVSVYVKHSWLAHTVVESYASQAKFYLSAFLMTKKTKSFTLQMREVSSKWSYIMVMSNEKYVYPRFCLNWKVCLPKILPELALNTQTRLAHLKQGRRQKYEYKLTVCSSGLSHRKDCDSFRATYFLFWLTL